MPNPALTPTQKLDLAKQVMTLLAEVAPDDARAILEAAQCVVYKSNRATALATVTPDGAAPTDLGILDWMKAEGQRVRAGSRAAAPAEEPCIEPSPEGQTAPPE